MRTLCRTACLAVALVLVSCSEQPPVEPAWLTGKLPPLTKEKIAPGLFDVAIGDDYVGAIVPSEWADQHLRGLAVEGFWTPSAAEIAQAERGIQLCLAQDEARLRQRIADGDPASERLARSVRALREILPRLPDYRRQYVGIVVAGEKRVCCNFALRGALADAYWRDRLIQALDGGINHWSVRYDLEHGTCTGMAINGEA